MTVRSLVLPLLILLATSAATTAAPPSLGVTVQTLRNSFDLLDSVAIEVVAHNPASTPQSATFVTPNEYEIDISRNGASVWNSLPPSPPPSVTYAPHIRSFVGGPTPIVLYEWNEILHGGFSPEAGQYTIRATLLTASHPSASVVVKFIAPLPTTTVAKIKPGEEVTIAGRLDATRGLLTDSNGSVVLTRRIIAAPPDFPIVVRGYAFDHPNGPRTFTVERWAGYGAPPPPPVPPTPRILIPTPRASIASPAPAPTK